MRSSKLNRTSRLLLVFTANCQLLTANFLLQGCTSTPASTDPKQRPDDVLNDPMNYSMNMDNTDISGGGTGNYDDKAMKRDLDDFFNP